MCIRDSEASASMLIDRKLKAQEIDAQKKEEEEAKKEWEKARAELEAAREARTQPTTHDELVAYFFATEFNEMEYEIVKQRPKARFGHHTGPHTTPFAL